MYHAHFGLREEPFAASPDARFFYKTEQHREAAAALYYAVAQRRGFATLIGRAGLGKTSVLAALLDRLNAEARVAFLPYPVFDQHSLLDFVLLGLGIEPLPQPAQRYRQFYEHLLAIGREGKTCVVIIDEAQGLSRETLEAVRLLSNFEASNRKLVQLLLVGQPGLATMLLRPDCEQILQRLSIVSHLRPLTRDEVHGYIAHRLKVAGGSRQLFTTEALNRIVDASEGVPRNVNTICFNALSLAFADGRKTAGAEEIATVLRDLDVTGGEDALPVVKAPEGPPLTAPRSNGNTVATAVPPTRARTQSTPARGVAAAALTGLGLFFLNKLGVFAAGRPATRRSGLVELGLSSQR